MDDNQDWEEDTENKENGPENLFPDFLDPFNIVEYPGYEQNSAGNFNNKLHTYKDPFFRAHVVAVIDE